MAQSDRQISVHLGNVGQYHQYQRSNRGNVMYRLPYQLCSIILLLAFMAAPALAEKRVALVIGNSKYQHTAELRNPRNDATIVAATLRGLGFEVIEGLDLKQIDMQRAIGEFSGKLQDADVALLFYAGHGLQVDGKNYLVPVDARLGNELELQFQTVSTDILLNVMESRKRVSILLLDACRNNPLAETLSRSMGTRGTSLGRGLAKIETGVGTYIGFSTQPGNLALDGDGDNSPFALALIDNIKKPNIDIELMMRQVRADVIEQTKGYQVPWGNSSMVGGFMFSNQPITAEAKPAEPVAEPPPLVQRDTGSGRSEVEIVFWNSIKDSNDPALLQAYIDKFPDGIFVSIATVLIARLDSAEKAKLKAADKAAEDAARKQAEEIAQLEIQRQALEEAAAKAKQQLALLTQQTDAREAPPLPTATEPDEAMIAAIQQELQRLGCDPGRPDGVWGRGSQKALAEFARNANLQLAALDPSQSLLDELRGRLDRVCPLVCGPGQAISRNRCISVSCPRGQLVNSLGTCYTPARPAQVEKQQSPPPKKERKKPECGVMSDGCNFFAN